MQMRSKRVCGMSIAIIIYVYISMLLFGQLSVNLRLSCQLMPCVCYGLIFVFDRRRCETKVKPPLIDAYCLEFIDVISMKPSKCTFFYSIKMVQTIESQSDFFFLLLFTQNKIFIKFDLKIFRFRFSVFHFIII